VDRTVEQVARALESRYRVEQVIGSGGMATVYLARDLRYDRPVAVKVLKPDIAAAVGTDRFLREIRITAQLNHPHILPLYDSGAVYRGVDGSLDPEIVGVTSDQSAYSAAGRSLELLFYVMPYIGGGSLRRRLLSGTPLALADVMQVAAQVAAALDHAHRTGVVHRDIKPENVLFSEGLAVVSDFGIAKALSAPGERGVTVTGFPLGTPGYMSPEQAAGRTDLDARTDVFALASIVYEMLVGETPELWPADDALRLGRFVDASAEHRTRLDTLPARVEQALTRGLALRAADRFPSPSELVAHLAGGTKRGSAIDDADVRRIFERAAELEATLPTEGGALSLGGVERVAAEAGIPPAMVRSAARELDVAAPSDVSDHLPGVTVVRKPEKSGKIIIERVIDGTLPPNARDRMVREIERTLGFVGSVSDVGQSVRWSGQLPGYIGRDVRVTVSTEDDQTLVHVEEHIELRGGSIFVPGWGAAGGALLSLAAIAVAGLPEQALLFVVAPVAIAGAITTTTQVISRLTRKRRPELEALADRLATRAADAIGAGRAEDAGEER
jgi:serine/threonine protein kinase